MNWLPQPLRSAMTGFYREQHAMTRVDIATGVGFDEFTAAFEKAAPK